MIITKMSIPRRTVLRGAGAALALPLLDCMIPALTPIVKTAGRPVNRLGVIYVPNGIVMDQWTPAGEETALQITPTLAPLERFRDRMIVLSGLTSRFGFVGTHSAAATKFLTDVNPKQSSQIEAGISMDQLAARTLGEHTQLASLEVALESSDAAGTCGDDLSCAYSNTIVWRSPTTPLPMERNPRAVFERLFGDSDSTDPNVRLRRFQTQRSILDSVIGKLDSFRQGLGAEDKSRLSEYVDAIRDVERRIQVAEKQSASVPTVVQPAGIPGTYEEHAKLIYDLQALAYQSDLTRVITFMVGHELSGLTYPQIGVSDSHHPISHHQSDPEKLAKLAAINAYHTSLFAHYLEKLQATRDGEGSLLDHVTILYGSGISDGNSHSPDNLPILLVGGGAGQLKGGRHLRYAPDTRLANLHVALLEKLSVPVEQFGDSNGKIENLSL